ncbi:MAG: type IX secretion system protein PorQ [Muribaculaceae bacterium]|nr:type IX secretion system protein PorQ [Muribaculaceae bacterium]
MKRKLYILATAMIATVLTVCGQDGSTAYNFLNITSSARIYGLGGVNISLVDDDITVVDQNPALLGAEMSGTISLNYMRYLGGSNFAGVRYGHSVGERGAWSAAVQYFGYGSMKEAGPDGIVTGTFSPKDVSFSGMYSHDITSRLRGGIALKAIYSGYADFSAFALATDLGINYYDPDRDLSLSVVVANLGGQVKRFAEHYDRLPVDVRLGWSQTFGSFPVRFSITAWNLTKWKLPYLETGDGSGTDNPEVKDSFGSNLFRHLVFGLDLVSSPNYYISLGYNYKTRTDMATYSRSFLSGFSLGAGLNVRSLKLGLAFAQPHKGGTSLMFNISYNLSDLLNRQ